MTTITLHDYVEQVEKLVDDNRLAEAVAHSRHILEKYPRHVETYRALGKAYLEQQQFDEATDLFQRVLSADPNDFISHVGLSIVFNEESQPDQALWHLERAFEIQPYNTAIQDELRRLYASQIGTRLEHIPLTRGALARLYIQGELYQQAIDELRGFLQEHPDRIDMQVLLAEALWRADQRIDAEETCMKILEELPNSIVANSILAEIWLQTGRIAESQKYLQRLMELTCVDRETFDTETAVGRAFRPDGAVRLPDAHTVEFLELAQEAPPAEPAEPTADWVSEISFDMVSEAESETAEEEPDVVIEPESGMHSYDWLAEVPDAAAGEAPVAPEDVEAADHESDWFIDQMTGGESIEESLPDWIEGMDSSEEDEEEDIFAFLQDADNELTAESAAAESKPETDWFSDMADEEPAAAAGALDWLDDEEAPGLDVEEEAETPAPHEAELDAEAADEDLPDWLAEVSEDVEPVDAEVAAQWLAETEEDAEIWSADLTDVEEPEPLDLEPTAAVDDEDEPAELAELTSGEETAAEEEAVDWLSDLVGEEDDAASLVAEDWLADLSSVGEPADADAGAEIGEDVGEDAEEDWLAALSGDITGDLTPDEIALDQPTDPDESIPLEERQESDLAAAEEAEGDTLDESWFQEMPDWLQEEAEHQTPVESESEAAEMSMSDENDKKDTEQPDPFPPDQPTPPEEESDEDDGWLAELTAMAEEAETEQPDAIDEGYDELPKWLADQQDEEIVAVDATADEWEDVHEEVPDWLQTPVDSEDISEDEAESPVATDDSSGAGLTELLSSIDDGTEAGPDSEEMEDAPQSTPEMDESFGAGLTGLLSGIDDEAAEEASLDTDMDWLSQLEGEAADSAEPGWSEETGLDWLDEAEVEEVAPEPHDEAIAESEASAESPADLEPVDLEVEEIGEDSAPEDWDDAMSWLEDLAAQQDEPVEDLPTIADNVLAGEETPETAEPEPPMPEPGPEPDIEEDTGLDWLDTLMQEEEGDDLAEVDAAETAVSPAMAFEDEGESEADEPEAWDLPDEEALDWLAAEDVAEDLAESQATETEADDLDWLAAEDEEDKDMLDLDELLGDVEEEPAATPIDEAPSWLRAELEEEEAEEEAPVLETGELSDVQADLDEAMSWLEDMAREEDEPDLDLIEAEVEPEEMDALLPDEYSAETDEAELTETPATEGTEEPVSETDLVLAEALALLAAQAQADAVQIDLPAEAVTAVSDEELTQALDWIEQTELKPEAETTEPDWLEADETVAVETEVEAEPTIDGDLDFDMLDMPDDPEGAISWLEEMAEGDVDLDVEMEPPPIQPSEDAVYDASGDTSDTELTGAADDLSTAADDALVEQEVDEPDTPIEMTVEELAGDTDILGLADMPDDPDAALAWLEQMASDEGELDIEMEPPPIKPSEDAVYDTSQAQAPVDEAPGEAAPEVSEDTAVPEADEPDLDILDMPDDPEEAMAWLEQMASGEVDLDIEMEPPPIRPSEDAVYDTSQATEPSAGAEEVEGDEVEATPDVIETETADVEAPEPMPAPATDELAEDDILADVPDDPDEAMAWLEQLAARQGADLEELPSVTEIDEAPQMPGWMAAEAETEAEAETMATEEPPAEAGEPTPLPEADDEEDAILPELDSDVEEELPSWFSADADIDDRRKTGVTGWLSSLPELDVDSWLAAEAEASETGYEEEMPLPESGPLQAGSPEPGVEDAEEPFLGADDSFVLADIEETPSGSYSVDEAQLELAQAALADGRFDEAARYFQELVGAGGGMLTLITELEAATAAHPQQPALRRLLGDAYMRNGQLQKALNIYREALEQL